MENQYQEEWRPVVGYEGLYEVSNYGQVRSVARIDPTNHFQIGGEKKKWVNKDGYYMVTLYNKKKKSVTVHRLVMEAFVPNPNNLPCINHKDENKANNFVYIENGTVDIEKSNLEWCTPKYNSNYGTCIERSSKNRSKTVLQYTKDGNLINVYSSLMSIEKTLGFSNGLISRVCNGLGKTAYGFKWRYA